MLVTHESQDIPGPKPHQGGEEPIQTKASVYQCKSRSIATYNMFTMPAEFSFKFH